MALSWKREKKFNLNNIIRNPFALDVCDFFYLWGALFRSASNFSASQVFSPWMLKKAEQPEGGGSVDAI